MNNIKIIFILSHKLYDESSYKYGFQLLKDNGFAIELWDMINLIYSKNKSMDISLNDNKKFISGDTTIKKFRNIHEIENDLKRQNRKTYIIFLNHSVNANVRPVIDLIEDNNIKYGYTFLNTLPSYNPNMLSILKILLKKPNILFDKLKKKITPVQHDNFANISYYLNLNTYFAIYCGKNSKKRILNLFPNIKKLISVPAYDHEKFYENKKKLKIEGYTKKYAVFLCESNHEHPDHKMHDINPVCDTNIYLYELNRFFKQLEEKYNIDVIISAHPKGIYNQDSIYKGRKLIKNKIVDLVNQSEFVMLHSSASICMPILANKPIIVINSKNYTAGTAYLIELMASSIGSKSIDISKENINLKIPIVNKMKYEKYITDNLMENNSQIKSKIWEDFSKFILHDVISNN